MEHLPESATVVNVAHHCGFVLETVLPLFLISVPPHGNSVCWSAWNMNTRPDCNKGLCFE